MCKTNVKKKIYYVNMHYEKKRCFATGLATHHVYTLWMLSDKLQKLQELQFAIYMVQLNYNFVTKTPFQLCNSPMIIIIMSCWCDFYPSIKNLTHDIMRIFRDFFKYWYPSSIMIIHFRFFWIMTRGTIKSCHVAY
jgi:hypothetical protein